MIVIDQKVGESRKDFLLRMAIIYIEEHSGFVGVCDKLYYDEAECDGYCLAEDLRIELDIN